MKESATEQAREVDCAETARRQPRGQTWASLMARTFVIDRILRHLGVPTPVPAPRPARAPPLPVGVRDVDVWDDDPSVLDPCS